ncbi:TldD/PmbA family protein [bacterium]|nr:TldD/PmbA family protein [candidate division CSSED10-310 bacterium]
MNYRDSDEIRDWADKILRQAREKGADEAAVQVRGSSEGLARFSRNQIIQNMERDNLSATLAVAIGKREATVTSNVMSEDGISALAGQAAELARLYPENPEHTPCVHPSEIESRDCWDEETSRLTQHEKARIIQEICRKVASENLLAFGTFSTGRFFSATANTNGVFEHHPFTRSQFTITVRTPSHNGSSREDRSHHKLSAIDCMDLTGKTMENARRSANPIDIEPGDYTVILSPTAAFNYLMMFFWTLDARMVEENRSSLTHHFAGRDLFGERLFSPEISVRSRANHPEHPMQPFGQTFSMEGMAGQGSAASLFSAGLPVTDFDIVGNGYLRNLFYTRFWAERKGVEPVAFPVLYEFSGSGKTVEELIRSTRRGLYINSFWYIRFVDANHLLLTGLTRDGVFLVEDGAITHPVKNLRFNESPLVSLGNVRDTGIPERRQGWLSTVLIPPMVIDAFTFSAQTEAI